MKNSIDLAFKTALKENRPALISYTVCGDNNKKVSLDILESISKNLDHTQFWNLFYILIYTPANAFDRDCKINSSFNDQLNTLLGLYLMKRISIYTIFNFVNFVIKS